MMKRTGLLGYGGCWAITGPAAASSMPSDKARTIIVEQLIFGHPQANVSYLPRGEANNI